MANCIAAYEAGFAFLTQPSGVSGTLWVHDRIRNWNLPRRLVQASKKWDQKARHGSLLETVDLPNVLRQALPGHSCARDRVRRLACCRPHVIV